MRFKFATVNGYNRSTMMASTLQFNDISDFAKTVNLNVQPGSPDLLVLNYDQINFSRYPDLPAYRQRYFEIHLDLTAGCSMKVDEFVIPSMTNRLTLISPQRLQTMVAHAVEPQGGFKGYSLFFRPEFIHTAATNSNLLRDFPFFSVLNSPSVFLKKDESENICDIIRKIHHESENHGPFSREIIQSYLNILFLKANQYYRHHPADQHRSNRDQEIYHAFESLVQKHFLELNTVKEYADKLHVSAKHLSESVKKASGERALEIIHKVQVSYAKAQLLQTGKTISQVAHELNFDSPEYFSIFFKRLTGKNPSQFRAF